METTIGILGASHWHIDRYVAALQEIGVRFGGIWDHDRDTAERIACRTGGRGCATHDDVLGDDRLDLVLALPVPSEGPETIRTIIRHRVPSIVEKPVAHRGIDLEPCAAEIEAAGLFCAVPFVHRYDSIWTELARTERRSLVHAHLRIVNGPPERYIHAGSAWVTDSARSGGGALRNLGIHLADATLRLAGDELVTIANCTLVPDRRFPIEAFASATLVVGDTTPVTIEAGYTYPLKVAGMLRGGDAETRVATDRHYFSERDGRLTVATSDDEVTVASTSEPEKHIRFFQETLSAWRRNARPPSPLRDCLRAARLVDGMYDLAAQSRQAGA